MPDHIDSFLTFAWENISNSGRAKVMRTASKTAWIFGAGASHHYNLNSRGINVPLANGFFNAFHSLPTSEGFKSHIGPLISYINHYRGIKHQDIPEWTENIEDFMTSIEQEINEIRERKEHGDLSREDKLKELSLAQLFSNMNFIFGNVINESQNGPGESCYRYLLDYCGPSDSFITFNWDTLLDRALIDSGGWLPSDGYGITFSSIMDGDWKHELTASPNYETNWKLFKLHGSTNWLVPYQYIHHETLEPASLVPESDDVFLFFQATLPYNTYRNRWSGGYVPTCYCYYPPNIPDALFSQEQIAPEPGKIWMRFSSSGVFSPFEEIQPNGISSSPLLITPVRQKRYDIYQSKFDMLWSQSTNAINDADRIVIIGYSFPETDIRPLGLLRNALQLKEGDIKIEIVSPDSEDIASRIGEEWLAKANSVILHPRTFEDYLDILREDAPSLMRRAAGEYPEVNEWLNRLWMMNSAAS